MNMILQVTPHDPLIARDGRPFGVGQGNRMRGLPWPLPSVVAGSFRTTFVKANPALDFAGDMPQQLMNISVAGAFPVCSNELYLPAPNDCVAEPSDDGKSIKDTHRLEPVTQCSVGCDLPDGLNPVMLPSTVGDFKPAELPAWWPAGKYADWLIGKNVSFDRSFLKSAAQETREHIKLDPKLGLAAEGQIFSTTGLNVSHMPRFNANATGKFEDRFADVSLSVRINDRSSSLKLNKQFNIWHPLGGERRLAHWQQQSSKITGWSCPDSVRKAIQATTRVRMILATPAIFHHGWRPDLEHGPLKDCGLKLVGASVGRWKAVSGWALANTAVQKRGPKPIRRMAPVGSVYFFEVKPGGGEKLAERWLESVSDNEQEQRDGFGLALWGTW